MRNIRIVTSHAVDAVVAVRSATATVVVLPEGTALGDVISQVAATCTAGERLQIRAAYGFPLTGDLTEAMFEDKPLPPTLTA